MIKFRWYYDKDAETTWLNKMAEDGWAMNRFFLGIYWFEPCKKNNYSYQIDFGECSEEYRSFMLDTGVEVVQTWGFWIFLRKITSEGSFELYSDIDSKIEHYSKIRKMFKVVSIIEIICICMELIGAFGGFYPGYVFALLFAALTIGMINIAIKTSNIIEELRERKGEISSKKAQRPLSRFLLVGILFNAVTIFLNNIVDSNITYFTLVCAIIFMILGIVITFKNKFYKK